VSTVAPSVVAVIVMVNAVPADGFDVAGTTRNGPGIGVVAETVAPGPELQPSRSAATV